MSISKQIEITAVFADGKGAPSFAYTSGLYAFDMPELIVLGLPPESAGYVINSTVSYMEENGGKLPYVGLPISGIIQKFDLAFLRCEVEQVEDYMLGCSHIREKGCEILQICWPDEQNVFPFENGFSEQFKAQQIILGSFE